MVVAPPELYTDQTNFSMGCTSSGSSDGSLLIPTDKASTIHAVEEAHPIWTETQTPTEAIIQAPRKQTPVQAPVQYGTQGGLVSHSGHLGFFALQVSKNTLLALAKLKTVWKDKTSQWNSDINYYIHWSFPPVDCLWNMDPCSGTATVEITLSKNPQWNHKNITQHLYYYKKSKGKFLYSAVSSPQDCSKHFTLYFPGRPVQSNTVSTSLGSIQPYAAINAQSLLVHISTTVYSQVLIHTAKWTGAM